MGDAPKSTLPGVQILSQAFRSKDLGEPLTRVGFLFVAYIMTHVAVSDVYSFPIFTSLPLTAMNLGAYAFAFALIVLALISKAELRPKAYLILVAAAYAVILNFLPVVVFQPFYRIDSLSYTHYSAVLLLQGRNPYAESMIPSLTAFGVPPDAWSPLEAGGLFGTSPYPPLAFLVYVPILALGATDVRVVYLAFHLAGLGILYARAPPPFRGIAPIGLVMTLELVQYTPWGVPDILWVVPASSWPRIWDGRPAPGSGMESRARSNRLRGCWHPSCSCGTGTGARPVRGRRPSPSAESRPASSSWSTAPSSCGIRPRGPRRCSRRSRRV